MTTFIFIWIACAAFTAVVANSKGRSALGWGLLGLGFGFLALLAVGLASAPEKEPKL